MDLTQHLLHTRWVRHTPLLLLLVSVLWSTPVGAHEGASARSSSLDQAIALTPTDPSPWLQRAEERRRMGDLHGAAEDLERAASLGAPSRPIALEQALLALAQNDHQKALFALATVGPTIDQDASLLEARAMARHALGHAGACMDRLSALAIRPDISRALAAEALCSGPNPEGLRAALSTAERHLGLVPQLHEALIRSTRAVGDLAAAHALATELTEHAPTRVGAWLLAADIDEDRGASEDARAKRANALRLARERLDARGTPLHRLAYAEALAASSQFDEAAVQLQAVFKAAPGLAGAHELARLLESK